MSDKWTEEELAYDGSSEPMSRELTPRERDILCRVLGAITYPFHKHLRDDPAMAAARNAIQQYTRINTDHQLLYDLIPIVSPREEDKRT